MAQRAESVLENAARRARAAEPRGTRSARKTRRARANTRLAHAQAMLRLKRAGLRRTSSGRCANRWIRTCTSLENVREGSVRKVIRLKRRSGCPVTITGGTEVGHAPGRRSHGSGHKLDVALNPCLDRYITREFRPAGIRSDGAQLYQAPNGDVYARESDHWDILFR